MSVAREKLEALSLAERYAKDPLANARTLVFDDAAMTKVVPADVFARFTADVRLGQPTSKADQAVIATAMFRWARGNGATDFAHWFFPMRGGGGAPGGALGSLKCDSFIDLDWASKSMIKPFTSAFPSDRLFGGETDGSSFPNGGLRVTHEAAAFTTWDRASPCFISGKVLRIPCSFVTHSGLCVDDKTPLLRALDAVNVEGLRMLRNVGAESKARQVYGYLGWEQEFFVVSADLVKLRPDLISCGRTLFGKLPARHQQGDLNYFAPSPQSVEDLMIAVQAEMLRVGCPMNVRHNEVAPAQHEMCPIFCVANASADSNVYFMEVCSKEAARRGLFVLFHEKPFKGINGSGKHANWSVGTDTGLNFFHPGKTDEAKTLFATAVACVSWGLKEHNELVRCSVAHAGNDHRLGAQEAPPAIISFYPGQGFEKHVEKIIEGGPLLGYEAKMTMADPRCRASMPVPTGAEDRNRTAPFPFCGNRFEFRAVGSSQNCAFPMMIINTIFAAGMAHLSDLLESGVTHRDAVAQLYASSRDVIFTGNGYSSEWPIEAAKRGLPNLHTTPMALPHFASEKNVAVFEKLGVYSRAETEARVEVMYEGYSTVLKIEAATMVQMVDQGFLPACARDLATFRFAPQLAGDRGVLYAKVKMASVSLAAALASTPHGAAAEADYLCATVAPQMASLRALVDDVETVMEHAIYPYPKYDQLLYGHHF